MFTVRASPVSAARAPVVAVKLLPFDATGILVSATPPIEPLVTLETTRPKPTPLTVIDCPPPAGLLVEMIDLMVGRATTVYEAVAGKALEVVEALS